MIFKDKNMVMELLILKLGFVLLEFPFRRVTVTATWKVSPEHPVSLPFVYLDRKEFQFV